MSYQITIAYPRTPTSTFDSKYYLTTHMPLVATHWKPHGLQSYTVTELTPDAPYTYTVSMDFASHAGFVNATKDASFAEIAADVPKFSNEQAVLLQGVVLAREVV